MAALDDHLGKPAAEPVRGTADRRAQAVRTAVVLALAALAVYGGFILLMAERSQG